MGDPERLFGEREPAVGVRLPGQLQSQSGEKTRSHWEVVLAHRGDGCFQHFDPGDVDLEGPGPDVTQRVRQRRSGEGAGVAELGGQVGGVEQGLAVAGIPGSPLRLPAADEQLQAAGIGGVGAAGVEQIQPRCVVGGRLVMR